MWEMGMISTNMCIVCKRFHEMHDRKPPLDHYNFVCNAAVSWLQPELNFEKKKDSRSISSTATTTTLSTTKTKRSIGTVSVKEA